MKRVDLGEPSPRAEEIPYAEFCYETAGRLFLPEPTAAGSASSFLDVLNRRRSRRSFGSPSLEQMSALLWYSARVLHASMPRWPRWQQRPFPSAGGRHPVDIILMRMPGYSQDVLLYDPFAHAVSFIVMHERRCVEDLLAKTDAVVPVGDATVIWFVAQFDRTLSRYDNGESLVWRDVGVLIMTLSLVGEHLGNEHMRPGDNRRALAFRDLAVGWSRRRGRRDGSGQ